MVTPWDCVSCRVEYLVLQVTQGKRGRMPLQAPTCAPGSVTAGAHLSLELLRLKASSPKAPVPCSCTQDTRKWLKAEKRPRIHYSSSAGKGMCFSISSVPINTNQFVKHFACILHFLPLSLVPHSWGQGWPLLLPPQMHSSACWAHACRSTRSKELRSLRQQGQTWSRYTLKGDDGVLCFFLSKNEIQCKQHRESWSQITPPHNLAASPQTRIFFYSGWVLAAEVWEDCCPDWYSGDKDAYLGNHSFEHYPFETVLQRRSHSPWQSKGLPAPNAFSSETLYFYIFLMPKANGCGKGRARYDISKREEMPS